MKSIKNTLKTIHAIVSTLPVKVDIALAGGYAASRNEIMLPLLAAAIIEKSA